MQWVEISKIVSKWHLLQLTFRANKYNHEGKLLSGGKLFSAILVSFIFRTVRSCKCDTTSKGIIFRCKMSHISDELLDGHQGLKYNQRCEKKVNIKIFLLFEWTDTVH